MNSLRRMMALSAMCLAVISCTTTGGGTSITIDEKLASKAAVNWMELQYPGRSDFHVRNVAIVTIGERVKSYNIEFEEGGFAILSADYDNKPILAYSESGHLTTDSTLIDGLVSQLSRNIVSGEETTENVEKNHRAWDRLLKVPVDGQLSLRNSTNVSPLIETKWGQSGGYAPNFTYNKATPMVQNNKPPYETTRAPVGCAAVAFSQVLNFYNYPKSGQLTNRYCKDGSNSYLCETIEVDYNTRYNWKEMPEKLTYKSSEESIDAVSKLLYHVGTSVNVVYGYHGSSAKIGNESVFKGFKKHFRMGEVQIVKRDDYDEDTWYDLISEEIKAGRPVILSGSQVEVGGHAYILDGLKPGFVHVNWGWNGAANGWFDLNSLTIDGTYRFTDDLIAFVNMTPNIVEEGNACNGNGGLRCQEGLVCALNGDIDQPVDENTSDETGTCLNPNPVVEEPDPADPDAGVDDEEPDSGADAGDSIEDSEEEEIEDLPLERFQTQGVVERGSWVHFGPYFSPGGVKVKLSGTGADDTGDADLYVKRDRRPTSLSFHCRPAQWGTDESCVLEGSANFFVSVYGYNEISKFQLVVRDIADNDRSIPETKPCTDDPQFVDAQGYMCLDWTGYDCDQAAESWDYTPDQENEIKANCSKTCGLCSDEEPCDDDPAFTDVQGYLCSDWVDYDCDEAEEKWGYTADQASEIKERCQKACGLCPAACLDDPDFQDARHFSCIDWQDSDCDRAVEDFNYTEQQEVELKERCQKSCGLCSDAANAQ